MNDNFEQIFKDLNEKVKNNTLNVADIDNTLNSLKKFKLELQSLLEYAVRYGNGNEKDEMQKRCKTLTLENQGEMVESLRNLGFSISMKKHIKDNNEYNNDIHKALSLQAFRIIEKTRCGKRDEVYYMLARIFIANEEKFPFLLAKAFNPNYSEEIFKVFIYSFLCGALGDSNEKELEKTSTGG
jgi:hypothetical protein